MLLKGLYTVVITPMTASGDLDEEGFRRNLRFQLSHPVDGIVVLGTTGEAPTLNEKEKETVIRIAAEEIKGKVRLVVGTGSNSTRQTVENTVKAKALGADIALVVTPYYNKPTQEGIFLHFKEVSKAALPICIYNIQGRTGQNIQTDTLKRIVDLPLIAAVKESSGNISQMSDVIEMIGRHRPNFSVMCGDDALTLPLIALGGHGVLSVVSNILPGPVSELVKAALAGDFVKAQQLHYELMPIFRTAFIETNPGPIKAAMALCGMAAGPCRLPLCAPISENLAKLKQVVETFPKEWRA